ncbi:MAG: FAD-binding oxidoreductase, partial [Nocardioides sp.]|nr:FAD-binding oxidoreductase [Nocardioides sp.]
MHPGNRNRPGYRFLHQPGQKRRSGKSNLRNVTTETGWDQHRAAVERLIASYEAIPEGAPVRLAKHTTNLFRPRAKVTTPGLDVSGLDGVIEVDPVAKTADVQLACTYERLVEATLAYGMIPYVVPQLRTITLGGAVTGMGIESTSFRNGMPHESVLEMDVLTGAGEIVTTRPGDDLFDAFPNSYGSLGYATRLRIRLEPVPSYVRLRHVRFDDAGLLSKTIAQITETRSYDGQQVDGLDGVAFAPGEYYLTLATWTETPDRDTSDYTGQQIYYRSIQQRETD